MSDQQTFLLLLGIAIITYLAIRLSAATKKVHNLTVGVNDLAMRRFNTWKETELQVMRQQESEIAHANAAVSLQAWRQESEQAIRH